MLKILHINTEKTWRGGENQLWLQIKYSSPGVQNFIACKKHSELRKRLMRLPVKTLELPLINGLDAVSAWEIRKFCNQHHIDILHCHTPKALGIGAISNMMGGKYKLVTTKRTSLPISNNPLSRWKYKKCDMVICVSKATEKSVLDAVNVKTHVFNSIIETGAKPDNERCSKSNHRTIRIGHAAAFTEQKDPATFLQVAKRMTSIMDNVTFEWAGEGYLKEKIRLDIIENGLTDKVSLVGFKADVRSFLRSLDILLFTSKFEGFPTTILESMDCGTTVVASNIPGIDEIIEDGKNGLLADNAEAFCEKLTQIIHSDHLRQSLIKNGLATAKAYDGKERIPSLEKLYWE